MRERWKLRSPYTLKEDLTLERLVILRPMTEAIKKDILFHKCSIEAPPTNHSNEEKICQSSKLKYLNKDIFDIFHQDYIDFRNYINDCNKLF